MRKFILAPMALACLIGTATAQQAPTMNVGNFPATQAVTQSGTWGFGLTGPIPTGSNVIGGVTQSGTWNVGLAAGNNAIGSVLADLRVSGAAVTSGNPVPVTVGNFPATQTIAGLVTANLGTLNGAATAAAQATSNTSLASIDGKLGSLGQKPSVGSSPVVIASDQTSLTTKIDQTTPGTTNRVFLAAGQPATITTTPLAANATAPLSPYYTGVGADGTIPYPFAYYTCSAFADQAGTLFVESSLNDSLYFPRNGTAGTAVAAGATVDVKVPLTMNVMRCRFMNGATAQTKFMLTGNPTRY